MRTMLCLLAIGTVLLAGCGSPQPPEDAVTARDSHLPGLEISAWAEPLEEGIRFHGLLINHGPEVFRHKAECGHPWTARLENATGTPVPVDRLERHCDDSYHTHLAPGSHLVYRYTWNGTVDGTTVPEGPLTFFLGATTLGARAGHLEARVDLPPTPQ